jgi:cell division septum initiation protein DivIVA
MSIYENKPGSPSGISGQSGRVHDLLGQYEEVREELGRTLAERDALRQKMEFLEKKLGKALEQFHELEKSLADPEQSTNAIVYYRLRAVWSICQQQVASLAQQTTSRLMGPDRQLYERKIEAARQAKKEALERRKSQILAERVSILATIRRLEEELGHHARIYQALARRSIERSLLAEREKLIPYEAHLKEITSEMEQLDSESPPPYPGLPVGVRRDINLLLIALAQQDYLHFRANNVADQALTAHRKPLSEIHFGAVEECQDLDRAVREALVAFRNRSVDTAAVRRRAAHLKSKVRYSSEQNAVPVAESLNFIDEHLDGGLESSVSGRFYQPIPVNVLTLDYWNIRDALLTP